MPRPTPEEGLNENHRRRLGVAMAMLDAAAARILDLLDERTSPTHMTVLEQSITERERESLRQLVHTLQPLTAEFAQKYGLEKHRRDLRRTVIAELSQMWTIVEDCVPDKLRGMGRVGNNVREPLQQDVEHLVGLIKKMQQVVKGTMG